MAESLHVAASGQAAAVWKPGRFRHEVDTHARVLPRYGRRMTTKAVKAAKPVTVATPWGRATVIDEVRVAQRAGDRRFDTIVQLLEDEKGGELIRFAYSTGGTARRGPVTLRGRDLERVRSEVGSHPRLAAALGLGDQSPPQHN